MAGFIAAALMGYLVIHWLLNYLNQHSLFIFGGYCIILGVLVLGFSLFNPQKTAVAASAGNYPIISVSYPSSLSWLIPIITECNQNGSPLFLKYQEQVKPSPSTIPAIILGFEKNNNSDSATYLIGYEVLKIVTSKINPLVQLNLSQLKELFKGTYSNWAGFLKKCDQCHNKNAFSLLSEKSIQLWVYSSNNYEQKIFSRIFLDNGQPPLSANIAPDVKAMEEAIQINTAALGFLPKHWVNDSLKSIDVTDLNTEDVKFPIIASTSSLPIQSYEDLFLCVQNSLEKFESG